MDTVTQKELEELRSKGKPIKYFHKMGSHQWHYNDDLAREAGISRIPRAVPKIYDDVRSLRQSQLMHYKAASFTITGPDSYERLK